MVRFPFSNFEFQFGSVKFFNSLGKTIGRVSVFFYFFPLQQLWLDTLARFEMRLSQQTLIKHWVDFKRFSVWTSRIDQRGLHF